MPAKSGASHALAAFVSIILGSLISNFLSAHTALLTDLSRTVGSVITGLIGLSLPKSVAGMLIVSSVLAFAWGLAYHYARHGSEQPAPKDYVTDSQSTRTTREMPGQNGPGSGASTVERTFDTSTSASYQSDERARKADAQIQSEFDRQLSRVQSAFDDIHDDLVDAGQRDAAERAASLQNSIRSLIQTFDQTPSLAGYQASIERTSGSTQQALTETHRQLLDVVDELATTADQGRQQAAAGDLETAFFEECSQLVQELETTIARREDIVQQMRDTP